MCPGFTADQMIQNLWDWELGISIFSFQHFSSESNVESGVKTILLMNHKCIYSPTHYTNFNDQLPRAYYTRLGGRKTVSKGAHYRQRIVGKAIYLM